MPDLERIIQKSNNKRRYNNEIYILLNDCLSYRNFLSYHYFKQFSSGFLIIF